MFKLLSKIKFTRHDDLMDNFKTLISKSTHNLNFKEIIWLRSFINKFYYSTSVMSFLIYMKHKSSFKKYIVTNCNLSVITRQ